MHAVIISDSRAPIPDSLPPRLLPSSAVSAATGAGVPRYAKLAMRSESAADHDATLLVAALEEIESRRAAIEWLLEADLLCHCLV
jgi:hypothetical protein